MTGTRIVLADYARSRSEAEFCELVSSQVDWVYSTALRVVRGDERSAQEVAQRVFCKLALRGVPNRLNRRLADWLHRRSFALGQQLLRRCQGRGSARRIQAMELQTIEDYSDENLASISLVLDETIQRLGRVDRLAILLRFFQQLEFDELGEALGKSEDEARKLLSRALERMCALLRHRGIGVSMAGLSFVLGTKCMVAAPAGLAGRISQAALRQRVLL